VVELALIIGAFLKLKVTIKRIDKHYLEKDRFLIEIIKEYEGLLNHYRENIRTDSFINAYFYKHRSFIIRLSKITRESDFIFMFLGLLGAFFVILIATLNLNLEGVQNLDELFNRIVILLVALKPALYILLFSGICAILNNMACKIWNLEEKVEALKSLLENFLENEVKGKIIQHSHHLEAIDNLIQTIENSIIKLEDTISDTLIEAFEDLTEMQKNILEASQQSQTAIKEIAAQESNNNPEER
jgi:hypothetical protein